MDKTFGCYIQLAYFGTYINEEGVLRHLPNSIKEQVKNDVNFGKVIKEKINLAEEFIVYNILKLNEKPDTIDKAISIVMEILCAILIIEYYIMLSPQIFGTQLEENNFFGIRGTLIGRLNSLLKELKDEYTDYTIDTSGIGKFEDSFIYKHLVKDEVLE